MGKREGGRGWGRGKEVEDGEVTDEQNTQHQLWTCCSACTCTCTVTKQPIYMYSTCFLSQYVDSMITQLNHK